jgi:hypothetical protein
MAVPRPLDTGAASSAAGLAVGCGCGVTGSIQRGIGADVTLQVHTAQPADRTQPGKVEPDDIAEETRIGSVPLQLVIRGCCMSRNALIPAGPVDPPVVVLHAGTIPPARYRKTSRRPGPPPEHSPCRAGEDAAHPHFQLPPRGGQAGPSRAACRAAPPQCRRRLAGRTSSRPLSLPSPAGYPPAHINRIRTTTSGAAVPKSSTQLDDMHRAGLS